MTFQRMILGKRGARLFRPKDRLVAKQVLHNNTIRGCVENTTHSLMAYRTFT